MGDFYFGDIYYFILVLPAFILSLIAQFYVKNQYNKASRIMSASGYTGATAAQAVLRHYGISNVRIEQCAGRLSDHYDPRSNVIRLSDGVFGSSSVAAIGIACHEAGHAAQHAEGYMPIKVRNYMLPLCKIGSYAGLPLALIGYFLSFEPLVWIGILLYSVIVLFQLCTLPVEFNASARAISVMESTALLRSDGELAAAKKVLRAAALTYVASLAVALANLLRFIMIFTRKRN